MKLIHIKGAKNNKFFENLLIDIDSVVEPDEFYGHYVIVRSELDDEDEECGFTQEEKDKYKYIAYFHHSNTDFINGHLYEIDYSKTAVVVAFGNDKIKNYCYNYGRNIDINTIPVIEKFEELELEINKRNNN